MNKDQDFDWVTARNSCSPHAVFLRLRNGAKHDVAVREKQLKESAKLIGFKVEPIIEGKSFCVRRSGDKLTDSVDFRWSDLGISAHREDDTTIVEASLTLNDEAECRLKIGQVGQEEIITFWQFRQRALEDLFFKF